MPTMEVFWIFVVICLGGVFLFLTGAATGAYDEETRWKAETVKLGLAEWVSDENGRAKWQWKEKLL